MTAILRTLLQPRSPAEAVEVVGSDPEAVIVAGGSWVLPEIASGLRDPRTLVDLHMARLNGIGEAGDTLVIGAMATYSDLLESELIREHAPVLTLACSGITGGPQLRNWATLVGAACYANPSSDAPGVLTALQARIRIESPGSSRLASATDFFLGPLQPDVQPGELVTSVSIPKVPETTRCGYYKLKNSEASWPIATSSVLVGQDGHTFCVLGGIGPKPLAMRFQVPPKAEESATPGEWWRLVEDQILGMCEETFSDELAMDWYRRAVASTVVWRSLLVAFGRPHA